MVPVSSGHRSDHEQIADALSHLRIRHKNEWRAIIDEFPTAANLRWSGAYFDVDAMGVDVEWADWLGMAIEDSQRIMWEGGEPYCIECDA